MGTRFGRRLADGTTEYFDSRQQLDAAVEQERKEGEKALFGFLGVVVGGVGTYALIGSAGADQWPKLLRFLAVLSGAGVTSYVLMKLSSALMAIFSFLLGSAVLVGIGALIWHFV